MNIPSPFESDITFPSGITWNLFHTLIASLMRDLVYCMETARVLQAVLHVQAYVRQENRQREGQMDRSSGAWLRYVATTPDVLRLWIYRSHPHKHTHTDNGPKNRGRPAHSIHKRTHPPRDLCTCAAHSDDWITTAESRKNIRTSKNELIYGIILVQTLMTCHDKNFPIKWIWHAACGLD